MNQYDIPITLPAFHHLVAQLFSCKPLLYDNVHKRNLYQSDAEVLNNLITTTNDHLTTITTQWEVNVEFAATEVAAADKKVVYKLVVENSGSIEATVELEIFGKFSDLLFLVVSTLQASILSMPYLLIDDSVKNIAPKNKVLVT